MCATAAALAIWPAVMVKRMTAPDDEWSFNMLNKDFSGPRVVTENDEGKEVSCAVVAALRMQDKKHPQSLVP